MIKVFIKSILFILLCHYSIESAVAGIITGVVQNVETGEPISAVTVRVVGTGQSMLANDVGQYRLILKPGSYRLKFSHVAYRSEFREVQVLDSGVTLNIAMKETLIQLPGMTVYDRLYDPAQEIIIKAIAHKQEILRQLQNYRFDAYVKEVVYSQTNNDTSKFYGITETQLECF